MEPSADVDAEVVDALVREQHPALAGEVRLVSQGWDNDMYRLGDAHAVRLPRREDSAFQVENEVRWMPEFTARLSVPIPTPVAVGRPGPRFPRSWTIVPWFPGTVADAMPPADRSVFAEQLAEAVLALAIPAPEAAPRNALRGVPMAENDESVRRWIGAAPVEPDVATGLCDAWGAGLAADTWTGPPVWLHSDLHPANLVVGADGLLAAIVDFGDLGSGDPACDLDAAWMTFDTAGRERFRARIDDAGRYDAATWIRARAWAAAMAAITACSPAPRTRAMGVAMARQATAD